MSTPSDDIILVHYTFSPYARRIVWYLALRGIPYAQCLVAPILPREDISALGVKYRRIPILSIGRDIYCDTRLILLKLESLFPSHALGASSSRSETALAQLLEQWTVDGGVFPRCGQLIPADVPLIKDPKFKKDREDYAGRSWQESDIIAGRPEALAAMRGFFGFLEEGLLADGREWIGGTEAPSMADIHSVWPFYWVLGIPGALPPHLFSAEIYPKVYAWVARFSSAVDAAKKTAPEPVTLQGEELVKRVTSAEFAEQTARVDEEDPLGLKEGQEVEFWPTDTGFNHKDRGKLVGLTKVEVVIEAQSKVEGKVVRIHAPRVGFRVRAVGGGGSKI
ncbi:MAG: hypothetical protein Q9195_002026 [Heterodermia aff. obscurata]